MTRVSYSPLSIFLKLALAAAVCGYAWLMYLVFWVWHARSVGAMIVAALFSLLMIFTVLAATTRFVITTQGLRETSVALRNNLMPWPEIRAFMVYSDRDFAMSSSALVGLLFRILPFRRPVRITYFVKFTDGRGSEISIKLDKRSAPFIKQILPRLHRPEKFFEPPGEFEGKKFDAQAQWAKLIPPGPPVL